jgi:flavin reductase (DIM6/NTAB) family NADH-FMN oxidoreductase RutF
MVQQSSTEYADGVNEFLKAGFTAVPSDVFRVKESPVQFECKEPDNSIRK